MVKILQKIGKKWEEPIVECNHCKGKMNLEMEDEGGAMIFLCEDCGTKMIDCDGDVDWTYPKKYKKQSFKEVNKENYYEE
jgi:hypothetical protein